MASLTSHCLRPLYQPTALRRQPSSQMGPVSCLRLLETCHNQPLKGFHYYWCECNWMVVIIILTDDSHRNAYRWNHSTTDAISAVIHHTLTHLETSSSCIRLLFLDYCSAFNTIILQTLVNKLAALGLVPSLCNRILDFLTNRPQSLRINNITSAPIILNTGSPKAVFSAHFSTHCLLMTAELTITATLW